MTFVSRCHPVLSEDPHNQESRIKLERPFVRSPTESGVIPLVSHRLTTLSRSSQYLIFFGSMPAFSHSSRLCQKTIGPTPPGNPCDLSWDSKASMPAG